MQQGVYITVMGMAILFAALLVLMLAAMGLERLFRPKEIKEEVPLEVEREKELVAAIAVAMAREIEAKSSKLKARSSKLKAESSERMLSAWKFWGRYRQLMGSREVRGHQGR